MASNGNSPVNVISSGNIYLLFTWETNSQSVANNTSVIAWKLQMVSTEGATIASSVKKDWSVTVNGQSYSGQNYIKLGANETILLASGVTTIEHTLDGTKSFSYSFTQEIQVEFTNDGRVRSVSGSGSGTLDQISRASALIVANGTLGTEQTLTIERKADTFKHRLTYRCGDTAEYLAGSMNSYSTTTSIAWTPRIGLAAENTTGTTVSITLTLYTYTSDGTHIGTTTEIITCTIPTSVKPSVTIAWEDITGAAGLYGQPVQNLSKLDITLTEQTSYGSPIASRSITVNGISYPDAEATTEALKESGSQKIAATIKDQRGRSGSNSVSLDVLAYNAPVVSKLVVHRCNKDGTENDQGDYIQATFSAAITDLVSKNHAEYKLLYKDSTDEYYTEVELTDLDGVYTVTDYAYIFAANGNSSYDVEVVATDNHGTATRATSASTAFTLLNWNASGTGMGVGKVSEREYAVEFNLDLYDKNEDKILGLGDLVKLLYPVGSITLRYDHIDPGSIYGGTWTRISSYLLRGVTADGTIGETGTIGSGSGQTFIDVSIWRRTA